MCSSKRTSYAQSARMKITRQKTMIKEGQKTDGLYWVRRTLYWVTLYIVRLFTRSKHAAVETCRRISYHAGVIRAYVGPQYTKDNIHCDNIIMVQNTCILLKNAMLTLLKMKEAIGYSWIRFKQNNDIAL